MNGSIQFGNPSEGNLCGGTYNELPMEETPLSKFKLPKAPDTARGVVGSVHIKRDGENPISSLSARHVIFIYFGGDKPLLI